MHIVSGVKQLYKDGLKKKQSPSPFPVLFTAEASIF